MQKRVLIIAANLKIAGAQKMIEQLVLHLDSDLVRVRVIVLSNRLETAIEKRLDAAGVDVRYLGKQKGLSFALFGKMKAELDNFSPDLIHTHVNSWLYILPAVLCGRYQMLHTIHSSPERQERYALLRVIMRYLYRAGKAIPVAISDQIRNEATKVYGISHEHIELVYNPVDYHLFADAKRKEHAGIVFVNVARFNPIKNHLFLIKCFSRVYKVNPDTRLVLAGDGELLQETKALVEALGLQQVVEFKGNVDDVATLLSECDVFVLPSLSEGMPISLLEAEAASLPVIASRTGGIPDVVDSNGILVEVNCEEALVNAMIDIASHPEKRVCMGERSKAIAVKYSSETVADAYELLYYKHGKRST